MMMQKYFPKPHMFYLALLTFGISFGFTFQLANLSSIFKFLGAASHELPFLWLAPPVTGLIIQPLIGQLSDDTFTRYGKRKPYIIGWGILGCIGFLTMPFFNSLMAAVLFTWLIDASLNGSTETMRALTSDLSQKRERSQAFALQAFLGGLGAALGTGLPYLMHKLYLSFHSDVSVKIGQMPANLKFSFWAAGIILGLSVCISMYKVKEPDYKSEKLQDKKSAQKSVTLFKRGMKVFQDLGRNVKESSPQFRKFCFYQTLTWLGIFIFWLYFTIALAQNMYSLPIILHIDNPPPHYAHVLQEANLSASLYLSIYQYVSVIYALLLFFALKNTEKTKLIHGVSLLIGGAAMAVLWVTHTKLLLVICMIGIGVMWGSIVVMPYAIVSQILPKGKFGTYLGIFNISITIPQIISGLTLSPIYVYIFKGHAPYVMLLAGVLIMMSALFWLKESYRSSEISFKKKEEYFSDKVEIPMEK